MRRAILAFIGLVAFAGCREDRPAEPRPTGSTPPGGGAASSTAASVPSVSPTSPATPDGAALAQARSASMVRSDEQVVLFPSLVVKAASGETLVADIHGWIYEPEEKSWKREEVMEEIHEYVVLTDPVRRETFDRRARSFLYDNESGKVLTVSIGGKIAELPASEGDGHFFGRVDLSPTDVAGHGGNLRVRALLQPGDERDFSTHALIQDASGLLLISDIDDTVKITEVTDKAKLLANTFTEPFRAVPGMSDLYRKWLTPGSHLHFLSGSPWQLYEPLAAMLDDAGFPPATFHLKRFNLGDRSMADLLADPEAMKVTAIEATIARLPARDLVLVGDSGEKDPEVYGTIARSHPERVRRIAIRDVTSEPRDAPRYKVAFEGVAPDRWTIFTDPAALPPP